MTGVPNTPEALSHCGHVSTPPVATTFSTDGRGGITSLQSTALRDRRSPLARVLAANEFHDTPQAGLDLPGLSKRRPGGRFTRLTAKSTSGYQPDQHVQVNAQEH